MKKNKTRINNNQSITIIKEISQLPKIRIYKIKLVKMMIKSQEITSLICILN